MQQSISELATSLVLHCTHQHQTIACAESCTGGMLGAELTAVPGSSAIFLGGVIAYANSAKQTMLGVSGAALDQHGAVSEPVAKAMAMGARERLSSDFAVGITGIAGPGGGSLDKPVGTVFLAVASKDMVVCERCAFTGDRLEVRKQSVQRALELLLSVCKKESL